MSIIPPEIKNDDFYYLILQLSAKESLSNVLEIGSSSGSGSTEAFVTGLRENVNSAKFFCMEIDEERFYQLQNTYADDDFVKCYNYSSVKEERLPKDSEVIEFYNKYSTNLNKYPIKQVLSWLKVDRENIKKGKNVDGIQLIKDENSLENFDLVLIDGSEFTGEAELDFVLGAKIILLDDINAFKNFATYNKFKNNPDYFLFYEDISLRNGFAAFAKRGETFNTIEIPEIRKSNQLSVHFFTIVLNGEPFIKYHINIFNKLPFKWHWHIVEGVAELNHDTAWSLENGGEISESVHSNGRSNDGTSEYIDKIELEYPNNVTVYRKEEGKFWDGKLEMINAPLKNITEEVILWQVDVDEFWTVEQIEKMYKVYVDNPLRTASFHLCYFFVAPKLFITTVNTYGNNTSYEWIRTWRYKPGDMWLSHEPPQLSRKTFSGKWNNLANINPLTHKETVDRGLIFQHYAYFLQKQLEFKESYYGYKDAVKKWVKLQKETNFPIYLKEYFDWVNDNALVDSVDNNNIQLLLDFDSSGNIAFNYSFNNNEKNEDSFKEGKHKEKTVVESNYVNKSTKEIGEEKKKNRVVSYDKHVMEIDNLTNYMRAYRSNRSKKNILVISHERSGTHFLINAIAKNFPFYSNEEISLLGSPDELKRIFEVLNIAEERRIIKSHHQIEFLSDFIDEILESFHLFYIVRDGRDVITSFFHHSNNAPDVIFPHTKNISEFIKINPTEYDFDKAYSMRFSQNIVERWVKHIEGWLKMSNRISIIKYEELSNDFENVIGRISNVLEMPLPDKIVTPNLNDRVIFPRKGIVGDWKTHFTKSDLEFFNRYANNLMYNIGYYQVKEFANINWEGLKSILFIRIDSIGDNVLASSMLPLIKAKFPKVSIMVLCQEHISELYENSPFVDKIIGVSRQELLNNQEYLNNIFAKLGKEEYSLVLNSTFSREILGDLLVANAKAEIKVGFEGDLNNISKEEKEKTDKVYTHLIPLRDSFLNELEKYKQLLEIFEIEATKLEPTIWLNESDKNFADTLLDENKYLSQQYVVLFAGAQYKMRRYEHFGKALKKYLDKNKLSVIALGTEGDFEINQKNLDELNVPVFNLSGKTTIRQAASIIEKAYFAIGTETGLAHIACAVKTPNIILLGGGHYGRFMPYSNLTTIVSLPLDCYKCNWRCKYNVAYCVKDVDPQVIERAVYKLFESKIGKHPRLFVQAYFGGNKDSLSPNLDLIKSQLPVEYEEFVEIGMNPSMSEIEFLIVNNEHNVAADYLHKILKEFPNNLDAMNNLAVTQICLDNFDEAEKLLKQVIVFDEKNEIARDNLKFLKEQKSGINE